MAEALFPVVCFSLQRQREDRRTPPHWRTPLRPQRAPGEAAPLAGRPLNAGTQTSGSRWALRGRPARARLRVGLPAPVPPPVRGSRPPGRGVGPGPLGRQLAREGDPLGSRLGPRERRRGEGRTSGLREDVGEGCPVQDRRPPPRTPRLWPCLLRSCETAGFAVRAGGT